MAQSSRPSPRTATIVVSAYDSSSKSKRGSDFKCTGTRDSTTINNALAAFPAAGGKIVLLEGNYSTLNPVVIPSNVEFELQGTLKIATAVTSLLTATASSGQAIVAVADGTKFFVGQWVTVVDDNRDVHYTLRYGDGATILTIDGNNITLSRNLTYTYTTAANAFLSSSPSAILLSSVSNVKIHGSGTIDGNKANQSIASPLNGNEEHRAACGISVYYSSDVSIKGLKIINPQMHGIIVYGACARISIDRVEVSGATDKLICTVGNGTDLVTDVQVTNSYLHDPVNEDCICFYTLTNNVKVSGCTIANHKRYGINLGSLNAGYSLIEGNSISGIDVLTTDCTCIRDVSVGRVSIVNNDISNAKYGISSANANVFANRFYYINVQGAQGNVIIGNTFDNCARKAAPTEAYAPIFAGGQGAIICGNRMKTTEVSTRRHYYAVYIPSGTNNARVFDNTVDYVQTAFIKDDGIGTQCAINKIEHFQDILAASATAIRSNEDLSAATPITFTLDAQPDVPRSLTWAFDSHVQITAFTLVFTGVNAKGQTVTSTFTEANGWSGETSNAFASITSIRLTSRTGTGASDTMDIGIGSKVGLASHIMVTTDVFKVKKNNAHVAAAGYTAETTYDTVDLSTGGAISGGDDFTIWYRCNQNIIG